MHEILFHAIHTNGQINKQMHLGETKGHGYTHMHTYMDAAMCVCVYGCR